MFKNCWDWLILLLTFYTVIMVPYNLAIQRSPHHGSDIFTWHFFFFRTSKDDSVAIFVFDSIVDVIYFIDILFNFHTSYVTDDGKVVTDDTKIRRLDYYSTRNIFTLVTGTISSQDCCWMCLLVFLTMLSTLSAVIPTQRSSPFSRWGLNNPT